VTGGGEITSSAALDAPATAVDLNTDELDPNEQGPVFPSIPDFGEYYLAGCWLSAASALSTSPLCRLPKHD
jgi:hypothetical protein